MNFLFVQEKNEPISLINNDQISKLRRLTWDNACNSAFPSEINKLELYTEACKVQNCSHLVLQQQSFPSITGIIVLVVHDTLSPKTQGAVKIFAERECVLHKPKDSWNKRGRA